MDAGLVSDSKIWSKPQKYKINSSNTITYPNIRNIHVLSSDVLNALYSAGRLWVLLNTTSLPTQII
jgi:hypothetical protein